MYTYNKKEQNYFRERLFPQCLWGAPPLFSKIKVYMVCSFIWSYFKSITSKGNWHVLKFACYHMLWHCRPIPSPNLIELLQKALNNFSLSSKFQNHYIGYLIFMEFGILNVNHTFLIMQCTFYLKKNKVFFD